MKPNTNATYCSFTKKKISLKKELVNYHQHWALFNRVNIFLSLLIQDLKINDKNLVLEKSNRVINSKYIWRIFCILNDIDAEEFSYVISLRKRLYNWVRYLNCSFPYLSEEISELATLKLPHTSYLPKAKGKITKFFQKLINQYFSEQKVIIIGHPEFHKCVLECHNKKILWGDEITNHHDSTLCKCHDEQGHFSKHLCKREWHVPTLSQGLEIDWNLWPHENCVAVLNPSKMIYVKEFDSEIEELTLKLCYLAKTWPDRYKYSEIYSRHGSSLKRKFYLSYDSEKFIINKAKEKVKNDKYWEENGDRINSERREKNQERNLRNQILLLTKKALKSRGEKRNKFNEQKILLVFRLNQLKK